MDTDCGADKSCDDMSSHTEQGLADTTPVIKDSVSPSISDSVVDIVLIGLDEWKDECPIRIGMDGVIVGKVSDSTVHEVANMDNQQCVNLPTQEKPQCSAGHAAPVALDPRGEHALPDPYATILTMKSQDPDNDPANLDLNSSDSLYVKTPRRS